MLPRTYSGHVAEDIGHGGGDRGHDGHGGGGGGEADDDILAARRRGHREGWPRLDLIRIFIRAIRPGRAEGSLRLGLRGRVDPLSDLSLAAPRVHPSSSHIYIHMHNNTFIHRHTHIHIL